GLLFAAAYAVHEGDVGSSAVLSGEVKTGMTLFNDAKFAGATSGKSCGSCHPDGKGLEKAGEKKEFTLGGKKQGSLEEAVNFCIVNAIKGKAVDTKSTQMMDIVSYIKSLKGSK
ncbi:MAG: hypothetical protein AB1499_15440, partial [Nitrospirota bacterium]